MGDKDIIRLLEKIVDERLLNDVFIGNVRMCIDLFRSENEFDKGKARDMATKLIKKAGLMDIENLPNRFDVEDGDKKLLANIPEIVEEIILYLNRKDLNKDLATCLEFVIEDLSDNKKTDDEKLEVIQRYLRVYKSAINSASEYIHESSNHRK